MRSGSASCPRTFAWARTTTPSSAASASGILVTALDLTRLLREEATAHGVPGSAIAVLCDGEVTTACAGVADATASEAVSAETRFAVGSLAKSMTATTLALLAADGPLSLDDPAPLHVPELRGSRWAEAATIRDLLANRSRLPLRDELEFSEFPGGDDGVLSRYASELANGEPTAAVWSYSNAGWALLGRAIETVTGLAWEEAMRANLLAPLGLWETTFATAPVAEPRAAGHSVTADGAMPVAPWTPASLAPAGSTLLSTVGDLLRFAGAQFEDPALAALRDTHAEVGIRAWLDAWCLGWARFDWDGGPVWGWDGVIPGQRSILRLVPERHGAVVMLTNGSNGRALYRSLLPEVMEACFDVRMPRQRLEPSVGAAGDLSRFAGAYAWPDRRWEVTATSDGLLLEGDGSAVEALPVDDRAFLVDADDPDNPTVTFGAFDDAGRPAVLYVMLWGLPRGEGASPAAAAREPRRA